MTSPTAQVFVSSTWQDLQPERAALETVLHRMREVKLVGMEYFGSRDETTRRTSLDEVDRSHLYVGIFAGRYGSGITEAEYRRARKKKMPCFIYFKADSHITPDKVEKKQRLLSRLNKLKAELRLRHTVAEFVSPEDLAAKATGDLYRWLNEGQQPKAASSEAVPMINALHQLPSPPRDFTGRGGELNELMDAIKQDGVTILGLQGTGGVGKTALALTLARKLTPQYPDAQLYLNVKGTSKTPLSAVDAMTHVIRAYQYTAKLSKSETELGALYRSVLHNQRAILLIDNAADGNQVEPLIPPESCVMLVTSRQHFTLPGLFAKNLDALPAEDARELLIKIAPHISDQADTIAKLCGHLPLALRLAASALAEQIDLGVEDYVKRLTSAQQRLKLIDASLRSSYELLNPNIRERWRLLATFPSTFDVAAALAVWELEPDAAQEARSELIKYSLLEWNKATARYRLHDLARLFAAARLSKVERDQGRRLHAAHYLRIIREADGLYLQGGEMLKRGLVLFELEWLNIQAGQRWAKQHAGKDDTAASLCNDYLNAGIHLLFILQGTDERILWLKSALAAARRLKKRADEGWHLNGLGSVYWALGKVHLAIRRYKQQLVIARELGDRRLEGHALGGLGWSYSALNRTQQAIGLYEQYLTIFQEFNDRYAESHALRSLGEAYFKLGEIPRAIEFNEQALVIVREINDRRGEGIALGNLGKVYAALGETRRAIELGEQYLLISREIDDLHSEGNALWNLSLMFDKLGERNEAIAHTKAALEVFEQIESPYAAAVCQQLTEWRGQRE